VDEPDKIKPVLLAVVVGCKVERLQVGKPFTSIKSTQNFPFVFIPCLVDCLSYFHPFMQGIIVKNDFALYKEFHRKFFVKSGLEDEVNLASVEGLVEVSRKTLKLNRRVIVAQTSSDAFYLSLNVQEYVLRKQHHKLEYIFLFGIEVTGRDRYFFKHFKEKSALLKQILKLSKEH
jgi:hypothetical protein